MSLRFLVSGGTGNWNSTTNWSATSGGASGSSFPVAGDDVVLNGLSNANITVNVAAACLTFSASPTYVNTLTMTNNLSVSGNTTLSSGMTYAGAGALNIVNSSTITSNGKIISGALTFAFATATRTATLIDDLYVLGAVSHATNAGTINGNNIHFYGNLGGSTLISGTTVYNARGTGTWTTASVMKNAVTFNTTGTTTLGAAISFQGNLIYSAGTIVTAGNTFTLTDTSTLKTSAITWNNFTSNASGGIITLNQDLNVTGNTVLSNAQTWNGNNVYCYGGLNPNQAVAGTTMFNMVGTGTWTAAGLLNNLTINSIGGTITIASVACSNLTYITASTLVTSASTLSCGNSSATWNTDGIVWNNLTIGAGIITLNSLLTANGTATVAAANTVTFAGTAGFNISNYTQTLAGKTTTFVGNKTYNINNNLTITGTLASPIAFVSSIGGTKSTITLSQGATQDIDFCNATDIDSSIGQTIWTYKGVLSNTKNWNLLVPQITTSNIF